MIRRLRRTIATLIHSALTPRCCCTRLTSERDAARVELLREREQRIRDQINRHVAAAERRRMET